MFDTLKVGTVGIRYVANLALWNGFSLLLKNLKKIKKNENQSKKKQNPIQTSIRKKQKKKTKKNKKKQRRTQFSNWGLDWVLLFFWI